MPNVDVDNPAAADYVRAWLPFHEAELRRYALEVPRLAAGARGGRGDPRPPALVLDIDEVLLCNLYAGDPADPAPALHRPLLREFGRSPTRHPNPPYPGARELLAAIAAAGVRPCFVTGRRAEIFDETFENFASAGFFEVIYGNSGALTVDAARRRFRADAFHFEESAGVATARAFKREARRKIAETHAVVGCLGDQLSDLGEFGGPPAGQRLIPHPFYFTA